MIKKKRKTDKCAVIKKLFDADAMINYATINAPFAVDN